MNTCEKMIADAATYYQMRQKGWLVKHDPPSKVVGKKRKVIYLEKNHPDFLGHWMGHAVAIEAKYNKANRSLNLDDHIVKRGQVRWLEKWAASGGIGGILVFFDLVLTRRSGPSELLREAFFAQIGGGGLAGECPFSRFAHDGKNTTVHIDWFRENAFPVPEGDGGLAWGRTMEALLHRIAGRGEKRAEVK